ncbi:efflux RND transporter permease subunit [Sporosarcina sp. FA9]|uniref:efflux RND transporter permease subunit n=1 Tax=Sporosarcina sp. FA9 TaxID=3413030 RepID=UPI003F65539A
MFISKGIVKLIKNFPVKSIFITIIVVALLAVGASNIYMGTGNDTLVKSSSDVYKDNLMLEEEFGGESIIILYEAKDLLTPANLSHMKGLGNVLETSDSIYSVMSPVTLIDRMAGKQSDKFKEGISGIIDGLDEMGEKQQTIGENMASIYSYSDIMTPGIPRNQATLDNMIYVDGELRPMFGDVVVDEHHMLMMIKFKGNTDDTTKSELVDRIHLYLDTEQLDGLTTIVSGKPVLDDAVRTSMKDSMEKMMGLALLVMVVVLFFVFKVRWRILPLVIVLVAVIGTVGLMGWLQIPITMVSMAVFPILIGLGIDYAIQFQNRYAEEMAKEDTDEYSKE